jgi:3D (Asp-Asp-Asp) domain-containing protein
MSLYKFNPETLSYERHNARPLKIMITTLVGFTVLILSCLPREYTISRTIINPIRTIVEKPVIRKVIGTYYHADVGQTDARPLETADGHIIDQSKLRSGKLRWIALSRDLIDRYGGHFSYGDRVYVYHPDKRIRGWWILHDTMNKRFKNRIDFLIDKTVVFPGRTEGILISKTKFV